MNFQMSTKPREMRVLQMLNCHAFIGIKRRFHDNRCDFWHILTARRPFLAAYNLKFDKSVAVNCQNSKYEIINKNEYANLHYYVIRDAITVKHWTTTPGIRLWSTLQVQVPIQVQVYITGMDVLKRNFSWIIIVINVMNNNRWGLLDTL